MILGPVFVDTARLRHNLHRFHTDAAAHGVAVRAHVKGHRTVEIGRRQVTAGACGLALTRVDEVAQYVSAGLDDIVLAWPWRDERRLAALARLARICRLRVHVDAVRTVRLLDRLSADARSELGVRIVVEDGVDVSAIAEAVAGSDRLWLDGLTDYADFTTVEQIRDRDEIALRLAQRLVATADRLREAGHDVRAVAIGGTPAARSAITVPGVTEIGAGAYALADAGVAGQGICEFSDVAASLRLSAANVTALTTGLAQPWGTETATLVDGSPLSAAQPNADGTVTVLPAHICPALLRATTVVTTDGEHWPIIKEPP